MQTIAHILSRGTFATFFEAPRTYAPDPVWSDSARQDVKFHRISRKEATSIWWEARRLNQTRRGEGLGGAVGQSALLVLQSLLFDFLNYRTGQLDPSYEGIAKKTGLSRATVARALARLKSLGIVHWVRRCASYVDAAGRFCLEQQRNAYGVCAPSTWRGHIARVAHALLPNEWGAAPPPRASIVEEALRDVRPGDTAGLIRAYESDPDEKLAAVMARLGRGVLGVSKRD